MGEWADKALPAFMESYSAVGNEPWRGISPLDVAHELPRLRTHMEQEIYVRLLPGYVRQYIRQAASLVDIRIEGNMDGIFSFCPVKPGAMDSLLSVLESYPERARSRLTIS